MKIKIDKQLVLESNYYPARQKVFPLDVQRHKEWQKENQSRIREESRKLTLKKAAYKQDNLNAKQKQAINHTMNNYR